MGLSNALNKLSVNDGESTSPFTINWDRIKQLVDSTGRETYTFGLTVDDNNPATFYNLVLRYSINHEAHTPFILKYKMSDDFLPQYQATGSLAGFEGTVQKILINRAAYSERRGNPAFGEEEPDVSLVVIRMLLPVMETTTQAAAPVVVVLVVMALEMTPMLVAVALYGNVLLM